jgi:hypothetical protein
MRLLALINRLVGNLWLVGFGWPFTLVLNPLTNSINEGFGKYIVRIMEVGTVASRCPVAVSKTCICADMEVASSGKISVFILMKIRDSYSLKDRPKKVPPKQAGHRCCKMRAHRPGILMCASSASAGRGSEAEDVGKTLVG